MGIERESCVGKSVKRLILAVVLAPIAALVLAVSPLIVMIYWGFFRSKKGNNNAKGTMKCLYSEVEQSRDKLDVFYRILVGSGALLSRASLLLLTWLVLNTSVPRLHKLTLLGSPLWIWSLQGVVITSSYFVAMVLCVVPQILLELVWWFLNKPALPPTQYYINGLFWSGNLIIYLFMVLLSWLHYFRTDAGLNHISIPHRQAFEYITWALISMFVGSIFWFGKVVLLLNWSATVIYSRLQPRILITGIKYLYLCLLTGCSSENNIYHLEYVFLDQLPHKASVSEHLMSRKMDTSHLEYVGATLTCLAQVVSLLPKDGISQVTTDVEDIFRSYFNKSGEDKSSSECTVIELGEMLSTKSNKESDKGPGNKDSLDPAEKTNAEKVNNETGPTEKTSEEKRVTIETGPTEKTKEERRAEALYKIVGEVHPSGKFTFDDLKKWMVDAHKECVTMGRTLEDAKANVTRLDTFLSCVILVMGVFLWLLFTGIATTAVLVTIATPLLAMTFIFGDTAKAFFQGLVFCFATHPFDVGDLCVIDETELEVKRMNILTTTFTKIESKERILYPNSVLSTKVIINRGWQPDPDDVVELTLASSTSIENLESQINKLISGKEIKDVGLVKVLIKEVGENMKVKVHFQHVLTTQDLTHRQCSLKKRDQRSNFLKALKTFLIVESQARPIDNNNKGGNTAPISLTVTSTEIGEENTTMIELSGPKDS